MSNDSGHFPKSVVASPEQTLNTYYLLLEDQVGTLTRKERGVTLGEEPVHVLRGSILYEQYSDQAQRGHFVLADQENTSLNTNISQDLSQVARLNSQQLGYLEAIPVLFDRWRVFIDKQWLSEAHHINVNSVVLVSLQDHPERLSGLVRYKGTVTDWKGIWFGIELSAEHQGKGTTDGVFRRKRYFQCLKDTGVFVAINRVQLCYDPSVFRPSFITEAGIYKPPAVYTTEKAPLDIGERVVWLSDTGPEYGTVRWIGYLPESENKTLTVGVELDNPVGSGTGSYREHQLFFTKQDHASLIPIIGLIRASQYGQDPLEDTFAVENMSEKYTINPRDVPAANFRSNQSVDNTKTDNQLLDHKNILIQHWDRLSTDINIEELAPFLIHHSVLNEEARDQLYGMKRDARGHVLLNSVLHSDYKTYRQFLLALRDSGSHIKLFKLLEQTGLPEETMDKKHDNKVTRQNSASGKTTSEGRGRDRNKQNQKNEHNYNQAKKALGPRDILRTNRKHFESRFKVEELLPELQEKGIIVKSKMKTIFSLKKKGTALLDAVIDADEQKFQKFLDILRQYQGDLYRSLFPQEHISSGDPGQDNVEDHGMTMGTTGTVLLEEHLFIITKLENVPTLTSIMKRYGLLTDNEVKDINRGNTSLLVHRVAFQGQDAFGKFMKALQESKNEDIFIKLDHRIASAMKEDEPDRTKENRQHTHHAGAASSTAAMKKPMPDSEISKYGQILLQERDNIKRTIEDWPGLIKVLGRYSILAPELLYDKHLPDIDFIINHIALKGKKEFESFITALKNTHHEPLADKLEKCALESQPLSRSPKYPSMLHSCPAGKPSKTGTADYMEIEKVKSVLAKEKWFILQNMTRPLSTASDMKNEGCLPDDIYSSILTCVRNNEVAIILDYVISHGQDRQIGSFLRALEKYSKGVHEYIESELKRMNTDDTVKSRSHGTTEDKKPFSVKDAQAEGHKSGSSCTDRSLQPKEQCDADINRDIDIYVKAMKENKHSIATNMTDPYAVRKEVLKTYTSIPPMHAVTKPEAAKKMIDFFTETEKEKVLQFIHILSDVEPALFYHINEMVIQMKIQMVAESSRNDRDTEKMDTNENEVEDQISREEKAGTVGNEIPPVSEKNEETNQLLLIQKDILRNKREEIMAKMNRPMYLAWELVKRNVLSDSDLDSVRLGVNDDQKKGILLNFLADKDLKAFEIFMDITSKDYIHLHEYLNNEVENKITREAALPVAATPTYGSDHERNTEQASPASKVTTETVLLPPSRDLRSVERIRAEGSPVDKQPGNQSHANGNFSSEKDNRKPTSHGQSGKGKGPVRAPVTLNAIDLDTPFDIGSMVEVNVAQQKQYGVIRWIGYYDSPERPIAGIELEEMNPAGTDGTYMNVRLFTCRPKRAMFMFLKKCRRDSRFREEPEDYVLEGSDLPKIPGYNEPPGPSKMYLLTGRHKGIQGHHNSCYMDTTLFSMFAYNQSFDEIYLRKKIDDYDIKGYKRVQEVLKERIVNRLRSEFYVPDGQMMHLRNLLEKLSTVQGLQTEEKDPEEFLNLLLGNILKAVPFIKLTSGVTGHLYQLFVERDESLIMPTTQRLLGLSLKQMGAKFFEPPNVLILQLPRSGSRFKMFKRVICSLELDITSLCEKAPKECVICGDLAIVECAECYRQFGEKWDLCLVPFCLKCDKKSHGHHDRHHHKRTDLSGVEEYIELCQKERTAWTPVRRERLELFAVMCIETSHYVAFVKCGTGTGSKWVFFDSMADREGGRNIPEVSLCPEVEDYLDPKGHVKATSEDDKEMPDKIRRLLSDPFLCMYRSTDGGMYT